MGIDDLHTYNMLDMNIAFDLLTNHPDFLHDLVSKQHLFYTPNGMFIISTDMNIQALKNDIQLSYS